MAVGTLQKPRYNMSPESSKPLPQKPIAFADNFGRAAAKYFQILEMIRKEKRETEAATPKVK